MPCFCLTLLSPTFPSIFSSLPLVVQVPKISGHICVTPEMNSPLRHPLPASKGAPGRLVRGAPDWELSLQVFGGCSGQGCVGYLGEPCLSLGGSGAPAAWPSEGCVCVCVCVCVHACACVCVNAYHQGLASFTGIERLTHFLQPPSCSRRSLCSVCMGERKSVSSWAGMFLREVVGA